MIIRTAINIIFIWLLLSALVLADSGSSNDSNKRFSFLLDEIADEEILYTTKPDEPTSLRPNDLVQVRLKDIATLKGIRKNQLFGVGLVSGLAGTGDDTNSVRFTAQAISNMLNNMGIAADPRDIRVKNFASVIVTADLPPFAKPGDTIDVTVSTMGNATSLEGGTLVMTPLQAADGQIYAVAQGSVTLGGFGAEGRTGTAIQTNFLTVGRIPSGAIVEREVPFTFIEGDRLTWHLRKNDFTTASGVADAINRHYPNALAQATDPSTVQLRIPYSEQANPVGFIAEIEQIEVGVDTTAKVVINEKNGTIVFGGNVKILPLSVAHGNITVSISERFRVIQPEPFTDGETVILPDTRVTITEETAEIVPVTSETLVQTLNMMGASPKDIVAIFQAIKAAGALEAELVIL